MEAPMASTANRTSPAAVSALLKRSGYSPIPHGKRRDAESGLYVTASPIANADAVVVLQIQGATDGDLSLHESIATKALTDAGLFIEAVARHCDGRRTEIYVARRTPVSATLASGQTAVQIDGQDYLWLVRRSEFSVWAIELKPGTDIATVDFNDSDGYSSWSIAGSAGWTRQGWVVECSEDADLHVKEGLSTEGDALAALLHALDTMRAAREERRLTAKLAAQWDAIQDGLVDYSQRWNCALSASENADLTLTEDGTWTDGGKCERTSRWYETALSGFYSNLDENAYAEYANR
jgi:hypothetical protein